MAQFKNNKELLSEIIREKLNEMGHLLLKNNLIFTQ